MLLTPTYLASPSSFLGLMCLLSTTVLLSLLTHALAAAFRWLLGKLCGHRQREGSLLHSGKQSREQERQKDRNGGEGGFL